MDATRGRVRKRVPTLRADRSRRRGADPGTDFGSNDDPYAGARQGQGGFQGGLQSQPRPVLRPAWIAVPTQGRAGEEPRRDDAGRTATTGSGDRRKPARVDRDARGCPDRPQPKEIDIRPARPTSEHGRRYARERVGGPPGELLLARSGGGPSCGAE